MGSILFICATTLIGFDLSKQLSNRTQELRVFIYSLQMIEAEMIYSHESLRYIFHNVQAKTSFPISQFYKRLVTQLEHPIDDFYVVWKHELYELSRYSTLKEEEIEILEQFGKNIGNHTIHQQQKQIKLTIYYLQKQLDEAIEQQNKYEKTVRSMSLLIGIFIVLILI